MKVPMSKGLACSIVACPIRTNTTESKTRQSEEVKGTSKMSKLNIEFDLDGVLINYHAWLERFLDKRKITLLSTGNFYFATNPEIPLESLQRLIYKAMWDVSEINPTPEARYVISALYDMTLEPIRIITARPYMVAHPTFECVKKVLGDIPFSISFVESGSDKHLYLTKGCYIDDRRKTCLDLAKRGFTVFMPEREYNMPIGPEPGIDFCYRGEWSKTDRYLNPGLGRIIIIEDIESLLYPENLNYIIS